MRPRPWWRVAALAAASVPSLWACQDRQPPSARAGDSAAARPTDSSAALAPVYVRYALIGAAGDTLRLERVLRTRERLAAQLSRPGGGEEMVLEGTLDADGRFRSLSVQRMVGSDAGRRTFHFGDSAVRVEEAGADSVATREVPAPPSTLPWESSSVALLEQVLRRSRRAAEPRVELKVYDLGTPGGALRDLVVEWFRPDSARVTVGNREIHVLMDSTSHVLRALTMGSGVRSQRLR